MARCLLSWLSYQLAIAQVTGFGNAAAMRAHFGRRLQTTPTAYRRRFTIRAG